jgi:phage-related protein
MTKVTFFKTAAGNDLVLEFIRQQPSDDRWVIGKDLKVVELRHPMGPPLCRFLGNGLWEVRSSLPSKREARFIYFFDKKTQMIVVLHGFIKTSRRTPKKEIDLAARRMSEFV